MTAPVQVIKEVRNEVIPRERLTVSQWAPRFRLLSAEGSAAPGRWRNDRAPYQVGMMDAVNEAAEVVAFMTSAQIGKSEILANILGYKMHRNPGPMMWLMPTIELAKKWSKTRLEPMLRDTPVLRDLMADGTGGDAENEVFTKLFRGGILSIAGANSPVMLSSQPIRDLLGDEIDRMPESAGEEGDPIDLALKRTTTFVVDRKIVLSSTPTIKGKSRIEAWYQRSDQRRYFVPCPDCDAMQTLEWPNVVFDPADPMSATYACLYCGVLIEAEQKQEMLARGEWRPTKLEHIGNGIIGFHLSELYSPWVKWGETATAFLAAKNKPKKLKVWVNTALGETWDEERVSDGLPDLMERAEEYPTACPRDVLLLTAGVDVQGDRLECEVVGWGHDLETWSIDYKIIHGDPAVPATWDELKTYLLTEWRHELSNDSEVEISLQVRSACIDTGGHHSAKVLEFCKKNAGRGWVPIKGANSREAPIFQRIKRGATTYTKPHMVGVHLAKDFLFEALAVVEPGPNYCHFPVGREAEYFKQLKSERKKKEGRSEKASYVKIRERNEALDTRIYAIAAYHRLAPTASSLKTLAEKLHAQVSLETTPAAQPAAPVEKPAPRARFAKSPKRKGVSFVHGWKFR